MKNAYDGRPFVIATLDHNNPAQGYILADGFAPAAIRGAEHGARYQLAPVTDGVHFDGNADTFTDGPLVGDEIDEFIAKRGGITGRINGGDVAPWPAWSKTPEKYTAILEPMDVVQALARGETEPTTTGATEAIEPTPEPDATETHGDESQAGDPPSPLIEDREGVLHRFTHEVLAEIHALLDTIGQKERELAERIRRHLPGRRTT